MPRKQIAIYFTKPSLHDGELDTSLACMETMVKKITSQGLSFLFTIYLLPAFVVLINWEIVAKDIDVAQLPKMHAEWYDRKKISRQRVTFQEEEASFYPRCLSPFVGTVGGSLWIWGGHIPPVPSAICAHGCLGKRQRKAIILKEVRGKNLKLTGNDHQSRWFSLRHARTHGIINKYK